MSTDYFVLCIDTLEAISLGKFSCLDPEDFNSSGNVSSWNVIGWNKSGGQPFEGKEFLEYIGKFFVLCRDKELRVVSDIVIQEIDPSYEAIKFLKVDEVMNRVVDPEPDAHDDFDRMPSELVDRLRQRCEAEIQRGKGISEGPGP